MLTTIAIENYRSIQSMTIALTRMNVITGANGSGKSNLYRAMRLLATTADSGTASSLAREGGLDSVLWAGVEDASGRVRRGEAAVQGTVGGRTNNRLKLGFGAEDYGYAVSIGVTGDGSPFALDPEFKEEVIWHGPFLRRASLLIERKGSLVRRLSGRNGEVLTDALPRYESLFSHVGKSTLYPEVFSVREMMRSWRFYDHFRVDADAAARQPQVGTRTPVLHHDGRDLAAALLTIVDIGDRQALEQTIDHAFPGARLEVDVAHGRLFSLCFYQAGLLRPLTAAELSDGTLRYLLLVAALLTPRPPDMMVLNEPEAGLHPDLIVPLARLIQHASQKTQVVVVSHSTRLVAALEHEADCNTLSLEKVFSSTTVLGQHALDKPAWHWSDGK